MEKTIVICGDSFNYGIGCVDLSSSPYGVLVSKYFGCNLIRLARGSATNFSICLQAEYAARKINPKPDLVVIGMTGFDRIEWQAENSKLHRNDTLSLENLNYHMYPPHSTPSSPMGIFQNYHLENDSDYNPSLLTEQIGGIDDYISMSKKKHPVATGYYKRLNSEPIPKLELIVKYYLEVFDGDIKVRYDSAMIFQGYMRCIKEGINCIILGPYSKLFKGLVPDEHLCHIDWGKLSNEYPDTIGSWHTSEEGHRVVANTVIEKIKELNLL